MAIEERKCMRCGGIFDHHGSFQTDDERICWYCFKKEEIKHDMITESEE